MTVDDGAAGRPDGPVQLLSRSWSRSRAFPGTGTGTGQVRENGAMPWDGHGPADPTERQLAQTSASSAGTVVARPSSLRAATDLLGSMPVNAGS